MRDNGTRLRRGGLAATLIGFAFAIFAARAGAQVDVRFVRIDGFAAPGTPPELNKVGIIQIGRTRRGTSSC